MKVLEDRQSKSSAALLDSREERVELLKAGFSGKEIEALPHQRCWLRSMNGINRRRMPWTHQKPPGI